MNKIINYFLHIISKLINMFFSILQITTYYVIKQRKNLQFTVKFAIYDLLFYRHDNSKVALNSYMF